MNEIQIRNPQSQPILYEMSDKIIRDDVFTKVFDIIHKFYSDRNHIFHIIFRNSPIKRIIESDLINE